MTVEPILYAMGRPRQPAGVTEGGEWVARARRDAGVALGLHVHGLVTLVNGTERGVAVPYTPELVSPAQAAAVEALDWMDEPGGRFVDTHELAGSAWVYFADENGGYTKVALTPDGDLIGVSRCDADRYNPVDDDFTGEFDMSDGDGYWPDLADNIARSLPHT